MTKQQIIIVGVLTIVIIALVGMVAFLLGERSSGNTPNVSQPAPVANQRTEGTMIDKGDVSKQANDVAIEKTIEKNLPQQKSAAKAGVDELCTTNGDCADSLYCKFTNGCTGAGTCQLKPDVCSKQYVPVCGCNEVTYGNSCEAASAGTTIIAEGACKNTCSSNNDCASTQFCRKESCGAASGICDTRPKNCPDVIIPACGCDGKDYFGTCGAYQAGTNISHLGACT